MRIPCESHANPTRVPRESHEGRSIQWRRSEMLSRIARTLVLVLSVAALVVAVAGCGTSSSGSGNKSGGTINVVCSPKGSWTSNFNPFAGAVNCGAQGMIYETLLFFNREDGSVKPWLASKYTWNSDGTSVTFTLQQGVKWSD